MFCVQCRWKCYVLVKNKPFLASLAHSPDKDKLLKRWHLRYIQRKKNIVKRPCKIWAPYGGHCVEKSLIC